MSPKKLFWDGKSAPDVELQAVVTALNVIFQRVCEYERFTILTA